MHTFLALAAIASAIGLAGCPGKTLPASHALGATDQLSGNPLWHWTAMTNRDDRSSRES